MKDKRPRGRPKGTGIRDDQHLDAIADLITRQPGLKKTPAISQIVQKEFPEHQWDTVVRRLLRKWNNEATNRLRTAQERYIEHKCERRAAGTLPTKSPLSQLAVAHRFAAEMQDMFNTPVFQQLRVHASTMQKLRNKIDPPMLRQMREQAEMIRRVARGF